MLVRTSSKNHVLMLQMCNIGWNMKWAEKDPEPGHVHGRSPRTAGGSLSRGRTRCIPAVGRSAARWSDKAWGGGSDREPGPSAVMKRASCPSGI